MEQTTETKPLSNDASESWDKWLLDNILVRLDGAYAHVLKGGTLSDNQIAELSRLLVEWPKGEVLNTLAVIVKQCPRYPSIYDWDRLRVHPPEPSYTPPGEAIGATCSRLTANLDPDSWDAYVMQQTAWGVSKRGKEAGGMREAYRRIIAEGEKRAMPEHVEHPVFTGPHGARTVAYTMDVGLSAFRKALARMGEGR